MIHLYPIMMQKPVTYQWGCTPLNLAESYCMTLWCVSGEVCDDTKSVLLSHIGLLFNGQLNIYVI